MKLPLDVRSTPKNLRPDQISAVKSEALPPVDRRNAEWYPRLGYKVSEALADLIDNSIDAEAKNALVRIVRTDASIRRVYIADDGEGMNSAQLAEAMQFGGGDPKTAKKLGKYGIGLKLASLSQAKTVTVLTRQGPRCSGRRWTSENIAKGWICEILDDVEVAAFMGEKMGPVDLRKRGTLVIWDDLEHLKSTPTAVEATVHRTIRDVANELGLRFHRFITDGRLCISIDAQMTGAPASGVITMVKALDPFSYEVPGRSDYPKRLQVSMASEGTLTLECHIWPPNSNEIGYKLGGGKVSARQGFYFYRNDRLIQAGGWNQCRDDDSEPHLSLARVKVDLPPAFDSAFKLDIKKSGVEPPPEFSLRVNAATGGGASFKQFTADAYATYRKKKQQDAALFTFLPNRGFPAETRTSAKRLLRTKGDGPPTLVDFSWEELDPDVFVELNREEHCIVLNSLFRDRVLGEKRASVVDAPLVKMLLLLLLQNEMGKKAISAKSRAWLSKVNHILIATLRKDN